MIKCGCALGGASASVCFLERITYELRMKYG